MMISFEKDGALALAKDLAGKLLETGFGALFKTDLYDYLLNAHSTEPFLWTRSNKQNALLLKTSPAKIKASALNIYLKFENGDKEAAALARFVRQIAEGLITVQDTGEKSPRLQLTVEDSVVRFCLDGVMKERLGSSPEIRLNNEILVIPRGDFYRLLRYIIGETPEFRGAEREELLKRLDKDQDGEQARAFFSFILDAAAEIGGNIGLYPVR
jgi:hypothetical protein